MVTVDLPPEKSGLRFLAGLGFLLFLSGCSLLFVQKGSLYVSSARPDAVPTAVSLAKEIEAAPEISYRVAPGDSLEKISRKVYGHPRYASAIAGKNGLNRSSLLRVGQVLKLDPRESVTAVPQKEVSVSSGEATGRFVEKTVAGKKYVMEVSGVSAKPRPVVNRAFGKGETLRFVVKFFAVTGGYAVLQVKDLVSYEGRPCYKLVGSATAAFPFSTMYTVDEYLESLWDAVDFFPWRFEKRVKEGHYRENNVTEYRQTKHVAVRKKNQDPPKEFTIPPCVQDILSCFYYARLLEIQEGDRFSIPAQAGDKNYELVVEILRRETIRVGAGKFDCFVVKPHVKYDNVFQNKGDILLWITADVRRLPVRIRSKILIGNFDVELIEARLPKLEG